MIPQGDLTKNRTEQNTWETVTMLRYKRDLSRTICVIYSPKRGQSPHGTKLIVIVYFLRPKIYLCTTLLTFPSGVFIDQEVQFLVGRVSIIILDSNCQVIRCRSWRLFRSFFCCLPWCWRELLDDGIPKKVNSMAYWTTVNCRPVDNKITRTFVWIFHVRVPAMDLALILIRIVVTWVVSDNSDFQSKNPLLTILRFRQ